jgi:hypothetical protein
MKLAVVLAMVMATLQFMVADDFKTVDGKEYKNAKVSRVEPDGIVITFSGGIVKILFTELSPEIQTRYGYDPKAAAEFTQESIAQRQALNVELQRAKEKAEAARAEQFSAARDDQQIRQAAQAADNLLIHALIKPYQFSKTSTHVRLQECFRTETGRHNDGLNVVRDYRWEPNEYVAAFNAIIDEPMPQGVEQGKVISVALYRIGHSEDSSRLPRFTFLKEKAIRFVLTGSPE